MQACCCRAVGKTPESEQRYPIRPNRSAFHTPPKKILAKLKEDDVTDISPYDHKTPPPSLQLSVDMISYAQTAIDGHNSEYNKQEHLTENNEHNNNNDESSEFDDNDRDGDYKQRDSSDDDNDLNLAVRKPGVPNCLFDYSDDEFDHLLDDKDLDEDVMRIKYADSRKRESLGHWKGTLLEGGTSKQCFKSALVLFSAICSVGYRLPSIAHSLQEKVTVTSTCQKSTLLKAIDSYHQVNSLCDGTINCFSMMAQLSVASNKTFTYKQAMHEKDYHKFVKAMIKEVHDHESRNHWTIMHCSNMPVDAKTIMSIWSFKRKRYLDGSLNKHKAGLCTHGGMQTWGQNYWERYAPVVNWASVCLILAIAKIHELSSKSINFVLAFLQADLENLLYMELPIGFDALNNEDWKFYVLKLNKSLYGLKQAG